jgi:hypothetical protein
MTSVDGLRLGRHPVAKLRISAAMQYIVQLRHDLPGKSVGKALCTWQVLDAGEDVVDLRVFDAPGGQL